jgi:prefoldin subunit 5
MGENNAVAEKKRLNDELESVRTELSELKARLSKVEAAKGKAVAPIKDKKARPAPRPSKRARKARS